MTSNEGKGNLKRREMENTGKQLLDALNSLNSSKTQESLKQLDIDIHRYTKFLPHSTNSENSLGTLDCDEIDELLYGKIIATLLQTFDENFPVLTPEFKAIIEDLMIVKGNFLIIYELLTSITEFLKYSVKQESIEFMISIIEKLLKSEALLFSIISACKKRHTSDLEAEELDKFFKNYAQILVSLPVKVSNRVKGQLPETFILNNFSKIVSFQIIQAISFLNNKSTNQSIDFEVKPISLLISKIFVNLGSENFLELIKIFIFWSLENKNSMRNLIKDILLDIPKMSISSVAVLLLENIENSEEIEIIFTPLMKNVHWRYILTTKILLFSYFKENKIIINLVNCLSCDSDKNFIEIVTKLFDIWGDRSALNHTNLEQHEFITKIILLSIKKLRGKLKPLDKNSIQELLFSGTGAHLEHMQLEIRAIGMITGELIIECLNESDAPQLKYDYDSMPKEGKNIVSELREFWEEKCENKSSIDKKMTSEELITDLGIKSTILSDKSGLSREIDDKNIKISSEKNDKSSKSENNDKNQSSTPKIDPDDDSLDSDDDLIPYDMSNDTKKCETLQPIYLRDVKENLINITDNSDPNIFAETLKCSENLIISQLPNDDASLALELLTILSKLREITHVDNFNHLKFKSCTAITKIYPKESSEYLCREFHAKIGTHSINDRLFFLNVLAEAARELSKVNVNNQDEEMTEIGEKKSLTGPISLLMNLEIGKRMETLYDDDFEISSHLDTQRSMKMKENREIVAKRIKSNTKVFAHPSKRSSTTINRFNDVASYFFFPLLYGIRSGDGNIFHTPKNFEDQGNILLINFMKTLSTIMVAAENCVIAPRMARDLLELSWNLRFHEQAVVRNCVIESIAAVIVAVGSNFTGDMFDLLLELRTWLMDIAQESIGGDPHKECREMARNVLRLIDSLFSDDLI